MTAGGRQNPKIPTRAESASGHDHPGKQQDRILKRLSGSSWPEETLQVLYIAMESAWLAVILVFFDIVIKPQEGISMAWTVLMYLPAYGVGRIARAKGISGRPFLLLNGAAALVFLAAVVKGILLPGISWLDWGGTLTGYMDLVMTAGGWPPLATIAVAGLYIWCRGWYLSRKQAEATAFFTGFQAGFLIVLIVVMLVSLAGISLQPMLGLIVAFFVSGLTGLYLARMMAMGSSRKTGGPNPWIIILPAAIATIILGGWALMFYVDRDLVLVLLKPFLWLWEQLFRFLNYLAGLFDPEPPELPMDPMQGLPKPDFKSATPRWDFAWLKTVGNIFFIVGSLGLIMAAMFRFLQDLMRWLRRRLDDQGIAVESLDNGFWDDLTSLLRLIWKRSLDLIRWLWLHIGIMLKIARPRRISETRAVRNTYRRMLKWGASRGLPKRPDQTPYDYLEALTPLLEDKLEPFRAATESYVRVRYGPEPADCTRVEAMNEYWRKIKIRSLRTRKWKRARPGSQSPSFTGGPGKEEVYP